MVSPLQNLQIRDIQAGASVGGAVGDQLKPGFLFYNGGNQVAPWFLIYNCEKPREHMG